MYQQRSVGAHFLIGGVLCLFVVVVFFWGGGLKESAIFRGWGQGQGDSPSETFEIWRLGNAILYEKFLKKINVDQMCCEGYF